ncbi:AbgT family transporter [Mammaliicoccus sp. Dog046]|uniref:AbgT family transporter n=1 Tax=Mammaliicoccus sp. Dog046 TaxID=3034233 RepID=UPI002B25E510|nr:AbgT family transporter [Mammaliicoccus sp. Dog046]WQK86047.1 AbgT family transporter [Mammaliicoccus sp. Dog046]
MNQTRQKVSLVNRFLNLIEKVGNRLPDPSILFFFLCAGLIVLSWFISLFDIKVKNPGSGKTIEVTNLISREGFSKIISESITNFSEFPALGLVLAVMLGIGVAEKTGYFDKLMILVVQKAPRKIIVPIIIFVGIIGNSAGDAAPVVLPPLTALVFIKLGYHPIAGLAMAYASALGAFAANVTLGMSDALVYAFTKPAAEIIDKDIHMNVAMNWYFIAASTVVLLPAIYFVSMKIVIPRLGTYQGEHQLNNEQDSEEISSKESRALKYANISIGVVILILLALCIPENGWLRNPKTGSLIENAPLMDGVGMIILVVFFVPGFVYGILSGKIANTKDLGRMLTESMSTMGSFIVIVFFAAQLLAYLEWSNLGVVISVKGAELLQGQNGIVLIIGFIILSSIINLLIGSASAKWAILAPIFIPMFMLLGYHPAFTQMVYRIGDSITNPITPMMPYLPLLLSYAQKYDKNMKLGTLISSLMPYSIVLSIVWPLFMILWFLLGLPLGPGGDIYYHK